MARARILKRIGTVHAISSRDDQDKTRHHQARTTTVYYTTGARAQIPAGDKLNCTKPEQHSEPFSHVQED